uniref:Uncharacterized protein n=1 Tax=Strongyloides papillosus TaxID=174720 RepID=A0A0N5CIW8_STREA
MTPGIFDSLTSLSKEDRLLLFNAFTHSISTNLKNLNQNFDENTSTLQGNIMDTQKFLVREIFDIKNQLNTINQKLDWLIDNRKQEIIFKNNHNDGKKNLKEDESHLEEIVEIFKKINNSLGII